MKRLALILALILFPIAAFATCATDGACYADRDVATGLHDGTAANPWQNINWAVVNAGLASSDVVIYVSAREAGTDTTDIYGSITMNRTSTSSRRLTLDGMTKWNTSDTAPSWSDYAGLPTRRTSKATLYDANGNGWAIGWGGSPPIVAMDNVTIRGFIATGPRARFRLEGGGSHWIVEYNYVHDVTVGGPGMAWNGGGYAYSAGPTPSNPSGVCTLRVTHLSDDVIFRYNIIDKTYGENLYFGGVGENGSGQGFNCPGHTNIKFLENTLSNPAFGGGEGDCFDMKNGNTNITYSGNIVGPCPRNGISVQGASISHRPQNVLIEKNLVHDTNTAGVGTGAITLVSTWTGVHDGVTIRNNIVFNGNITANDGTGNTNGNGAKYSIFIYSNTVDNGQIVTRYVNGGAVQNNIATVSVYQVPAITASHNIPPSAALFVDRTGRNYRLAGTSSGAYNTGTPIGSFSSDYIGTARPQVTLWDIGAYELIGTVPPPTPPPTPPPPPVSTIWVELWVDGVLIKSVSGTSLPLSLDDVLNIEIRVRP